MPSLTQSELALFKASSNNVSASSKFPMCMQQTALPFKIKPVIWVFSEKSWKMRYASWILEPPWFRKDSRMSTNKICYLWEVIAWWRKIQKGYYHSQIKPCICKLCERMVLINLLHDPQLLFSKIRPVHFDEYLDIQSMPVKETLCLFEKMV